ncbi:universal stress protein [bacterium]|nr:universal stress protein [bacterium]
MSKKILVTTDLSEDSKKAFPLAEELAKALGASVELLSVVEDPTQAALLYAMDFPVLPGKEVLEQLREKVAGEVQTLAKEHFSEVSVTPRVIESVGAIHDAIINHARDTDASFLIMATHGRTGLSRLLIGSTAERVVRECPLPVLTVPSSSHSKQASR